MMNNPHLRAFRLGTLRSMPQIRTWQEADDFAQKYIKPFTSHSVCIAPHTYLVRFDADIYHVIFRQTIIAQYRRNAETRIYAGRWQTVTTKARLRKLGFNVYAKDFTWYLDPHGEFYDGMEV